MISRRLAILLVLLMAVSALAQKQRRDPLTDPEIEKVRDSAQLPDVRLKLYIEFARARLEKLQQIRSDPKVTDREQQTREALQDFVDVYDELDENVDTFADRGEDIRKALKPVIEADTEFGSKLRAFKSSLAANPKGARDDEFLMNSAVEAVDAGAKDHRDLLAEQEEAFKHKKKQEHKADARRGE
jgi:hypothetical protein